MKSLPPKWIDIYPKNTKEGDEECRFFKVIERHPSYTFHSTESIAESAKLTPLRVEQIINKYLKRNMVFQNPANHEQWAYWENVPELLHKTPSLSQVDQKRRIAEAAREYKAI